MSMNTRLLLITFLCVFSIGQCIAQTWYTGKDNFRQAIFQDSILSDYNYQAEKDIVNITETDIHPGEGFRPSLSLDIANRNNRENKKYPVYRQSQTGTITKAGYVEKTVWGVVWGYGDSSNFHALLLRAGNPDPIRLPYSRITIQHHHCCRGRYNLPCAVEYIVFPIYQSRNRLQPHTRCSR